MPMPLATLLGSERLAVETGHSKADISPSVSRTYELCDPRTLQKYPNDMLLFFQEPGHDLDEIAGPVTIVELPL